MGKSCENIVFSPLHLPFKAKDRQKKRRAKGIKVDKEGDLTLEDLDDATAEAVDQDNTTNKKVHVWIFGATSYLS